MAAEPQIIRVGRDLTIKAPPAIANLRSGGIARRTPVPERIEDLVVEQYAQIREAETANETTKLVTATFARALEAIVFAYTRGELLPLAPNRDGIIIPRSIIDRIRERGGSITIGEKPDGDLVLRWREPIQNPTVEG